MKREDRAAITQEKFDKFRAALVKKYGENTVVTYAQLAAVFERGNYAKWRDYAKNPDYKIGRNLFVITLSDNPKKVRDAVMKSHSKKSASHSLVPTKPQSPMRRINRDRKVNQPTSRTTRSPRAPVLHTRAH